MVFCFGFCWRNISDGFEQAPAIEPIDPFQRCELDGLEGAPGSAAVDYFGLVKTIDGFGEGIVIGVSGAAG